MEPGTSGLIVERPNLPNCGELDGRKPGRLPRREYPEQHISTVTGTLSRDDGERVIGKKDGIRHREYHIIIGEQGASAADRMRQTAGLILLDVLDLEAKGAAITERVSNRLLAPGHNDHDATNRRSAHCLENEMTEQRIAV